MNNNSDHDNPKSKADGVTRYAQLFQGAEAVVRYQRKLGNRIDILRDKIERDLLAERLQGSLFDCTIGVGRFIGKLPRVTSYDGMDLSAEFVEHVQQLHPHGKFFTADLSQPIPLPSDSYDNVLCLRSLSGIGRLASILPEMLRITKPGGLLIFDYGRKRTISHVKGEMTVLDGDDLEGILKTLDATEVERIKVDAVLTRAKISARCFRYLTGPRGHWVSDQRLLQTERLSAPFFWQRQIIILRRN